MDGREGDPHTSTLPAGVVPAQEVAMPHARIAVPVTVIATIALALFIHGCGSSSSPTYAGGGGNTGGSTTFNMSFPATDASRSFTFPTAGTFAFSDSG